MVASEPLSPANMVSVMVSVRGDPDGVFSSKVLVKRS
jgi:hypothetical protein